jgi:hypothetical protein
MTTSSQPDLQRRALELARQGDFGDEAARVNAAIIEFAPQDVSAWTRLGRCHFEQRNWDEATSALRAALQLNPAHTVATNLLNEVRKHRREAPPRAEPSTTGFGPREFGMLQSPPVGERRHALRTKVGALLETLNATHTSSLIARARRDAGAHESTLFDADIGDMDAKGRLVVYQRGGRFSAGGPDADGVAGREQALSFFERFQQVLARSWSVELTRWMASDGGFIQYGDRPPAADLLPAQAVQWLVNCRDAAQLDWIFVGRWFFLDNPDHQRILGDKARLAKIIDDTMRTLYPLWLDTYRGPSV